MVNLLQYQLPRSAGGYSLDTGYKIMVAFDAYISKNTGLTEIPEVVLKQVFKNGYDDPKKASAALLWWYSCGAAFEKRQTNNTEPTKKTKARPYCYEFDEGAIVADFQHYYGIRLAVENIHWFEFQKLLFNLPNESQLKKRIYYRTADPADVSKYEKDSFLKMRKLYTIVKKVADQTAAEREQAMVDRVARAYEDMLAHELNNEQ